jgi:hypothetical protein
VRPLVCFLAARRFGIKDRRRREGGDNDNNVYIYNGQPKNNDDDMVRVLIGVGLSPAASAIRLCGRANRNERTEVERGILPTLLKIDENNEASERGVAGAGLSLFMVIVFGQVYKG